jgi:hypothetical protein
LEKSIHRFLDKPEEIISNPKTLKAEFSVFEATNKRTKNLDILFDALKTKKPSSVASERVRITTSNNCTSVCLLYIQTLLHVSAPLGHLQGAIHSRT